MIGRDSDISIDLSSEAINVMICMLIAKPMISIVIFWLPTAQAFSRALVVWEHFSIIISDPGVEIIEIGQGHRLPWSSWILSQGSWLHTLQTQLSTAHIHSIVVQQIPINANCWCNSSSRQQQGSAACTGEHRLREGVVFHTLRGELFTL